jgi:hypothetical protein
MKNPKLKLKKKIRTIGVKRLKSLVRAEVHACLLDIEWYIVDDIMKLLKKEGIIYVKKDKKKNKKKSKKQKR